jgi:hypothetical protein
MVKWGKWEYTKEELDRMHREAVKRARYADRTEPRATSVSYDADTNRLVIELRNGTTLLVPCELVQGLHDATPAEIAAVELTPRGAALHWETLDTDISVPGLMAGIFGTKAWMAELERRCGRSTAEAKRAATRAQGAKAVRPRQPAATKSSTLHQSPASIQGRLRGRKQGNTI